MTENTTTAAPQDPTGDVEADVLADDHQADPADAEPQADPADTDDQGDGDTGKPGRDAAKYRARLRETEAERDALRDQLAAQRRAIVDWRAAGSSVAVDPALLDAAGIDVNALVDAESGQLDMAAVDKFIGDTATRFNLAQGFRPNRGQGTSGAPVLKPSLADAFRR